MDAREGRENRRRERGREKEIILAVEGLRGRGRMPEEGERFIRRMKIKRIK